MELDDEATSKDPRASHRESADEEEARTTRESQEAHAQEQAAKANYDAALENLEPAITLQAALGSFPPFLSLLDALESFPPLLVLQAAQAATSAAKRNALAAALKRLLQPEPIGDSARWSQMVTNKRCRTEGFGECDTGTEQQLEDDASSTTKKQKQ